MGFGNVTTLISTDPATGASPCQDIPLDAIVEAVRVILEPTSNADLRGQAHALCEAVKRDAEAPRYGFELATLAMPLSVRLFGLNVLEEYVKARLDLGAAGRLRDGAWSLLALVVAVPASERRLMQDKTAGLVAQLALRIWPQYWPDFFDRLLALVAADGTSLEQDASSVIRTEMGLRMVRLVVQEIHPREGAGEKKLLGDEARRPELQQALALVLPQMITRLYTLLPHCSQWPPGQLRVMQPLLEVLMEAFGSIALWVPLETGPTIACVTGLLQIARDANGELSGTALEVLALICARAPRPPEPSNLISALFDASVGPVGELLGRFASAGLEGYDLFKRLADAFVTFCATNIANRKAPCLPSRLDAVLDILVQLSNFPSLLVVSNVAGSFWTPAARCEALMKHPAMAARLPAIFLYTLVTMAQSRTAERAKEPFNAEDFDADDVEADADFDTLFATLQNRALDLLRHAASYYPHIVAGYCGNALHTFMAERGGPTQLMADLGPQGLAQWTSLIHATDAVLRACHARLLDSDTAPEEREAITQQVTALGQILCVFTEPATQLHTDTLYVWLTVLRTLITCLGAMDAPHFSVLVQQLFGLFLSYDCPPALQFAPDRALNMRTAVRARAGTTILRVCAAHPTRLLPALDHIIGLYRQSGERERVVFIEMLLTIAGCLEDANQRGDLVRLVLEPLATSLAQLGALATDWKQLLNKCGLADLLPGRTLDQDDPNASPSSTTLRRTISHTTSTLYSTLTQLKKLAIAPEIKHLISQLAPTVNDALSRLILCINVIFDSTHFEHPAVQPLWMRLCSDSSPDAKDAAMAEMPPTEKLLDAHMLADSMDTLPGKSLKGWLQMLRISVFMCYGQLYSLVPSVAGLGGVVALFQNADHFSLSHWMLATKHLFTPLLLNAADPSSTHELVRLIVHRFGCVRLEAAWQLFLAASTPGTLTANATAGKSNLEAEQEQERLLTTATNSLLLMLFDILVPVGERDKKTDPSFDLAALKDPLRLLIPDGAHSPLARSIMHDRLLATHTLNLLAAIMRWRPTFAGKVIAILSRWLPVLMQYQELHATLWGPVTASVITAVMDPSLSEIHAQCIALLTELYKWQLFYGYDALDRHASAILPSVSSPLRVLSPSYPEYLGHRFCRNCGPFSRPIPPPISRTNGPPFVVSWFGPSSNMD